MRLAVISDTHLEQPSAWLARVYDEHLAPADAVLHCGDITGYATWRFLRRHPAFFAVRGNCDMAPGFDGELEPMLDLVLLGLHIGLTHGWGPRSQVPRNVAEAFGPEFDLVCFGHTHAPLWDEIAGVRLLNPGSLGDDPHRLALVDIDETTKQLACRFLSLD